MRVCFGSAVLALLCGCTFVTTAGRGQPSTPAVPLNRAQLGKPVVVTATDVSWTQPLAALIGDAPARDTACHTRTTAEPIASFQLEEPIDDLQIAVKPKGGSPEFVVVGGGRYWEQCNGSTLSAGGFQPGRYDVYPTLGNGPFTVTATSAKLLAASGYGKQNEPKVPAITVEPSGVVKLDVDGHGPYDYDLSFDFDVTAAALTEVSLRAFAPLGTPDEGRSFSPGVSLCDPAAPSKCEEMHSAVFGVVGTRRVKVRVGRDAPKRLTLQVVTDRKHVPWTALLLGAPAPDAPASKHDLIRYGTPFVLDDSSWSLARNKFLEVPRAFVIYATSTIPAQTGREPREIAAGEPLLLVDHDLLRANGEVLAPRLPAGVHLDMVASGTRPAKLVMPPAMVDTDGGRSDVSMYDYPYGDDTAEFNGMQAPELDAFLKARKPVKACIGRELAKRGSGYGYDVALYKKDGTIKKVQSLTSYIEEQVYKKCNVAKLDKQRVKLRTLLRTRAIAEIQAALSKP